MRSGALDFLSKPIDKSELLHAVKLAEERDRARRRADAECQAVVKLIARLTRREREVLPLVVAGLHNEEIATKLGVAHKTIKVHRARMMKKMGVRSLAELVRLTSRAFSPPQ
jgi:FixJ family two-component response regulator